MDINLDVINTKNENKIGQYQLIFDVFNELTHVEFKSEENIDIDVNTESKLNLFSIHFVFLVDLNNLYDVVNIMNEKQMIGESLKLEIN